MPASFNTRCKCPPSPVGNGLLTKQVAVISFDGLVTFPNPGPEVYSIVPKTSLTLGATFVGFTFPIPGVIQGEWKLSRPVPLERRIEVVGFHIITFPFDPINIAPFIPPIPTPDDTFYQWVLVNGAPIPPPGSPDAEIEWHTIIWTPK